MHDEEVWEAGRSSAMEGFSQFVSNRHEVVSLVRTGLAPKILLQLQSGDSESCFPTDHKSASL